MMRNVPESERPRERMLNSGAASLSNAELIAILLRTGSSRESVLSLACRLLNEVGELRGLKSISYEELTAIKGIGPAKALLLIAGLELGKRISGESGSVRPAVRSPQDVANVMMEEMRFLTQEHFVCLYLNTKNQLIGRTTVFIGSLNSSIVHPREVFKEAIRKSSASVVCLHNHPSGDPTPSREDVEVTHRLQEAGRILGIDVLDHVIIGDGRFYSLKEKGHFK
ncbi:DNA repair protein RadC [Aneurinibacillus sp. Ricciae_BoGa-3]|uniref:RadC family protein n=1 Tax=Aneurinibacillus sp. Ricciae_BoGa-3 TaxID=3022697 RepID=UPI0023405C46|nr:DNA repair protein RadC [Aneurinibacillus sp. Ricciae_BoGa-3]WCK56879.1 DNA repair protein RadC [Aneurinibacillus sp. Ricciae_BoGa-3]